MAKELLKLAVLMIGVLAGGTTCALVAYTFGWWVIPLFVVLVLLCVWLFFKLYPI